MRAASPFHVDLQRSRTRKRTNYVTCTIVNTIYYLEILQQVHGLCCPRPLRFHSGESVAYSNGLVCRFSEPVLHAL